MAGSTVNTPTSRGSASSSKQPSVQTGTAAQTASVKIDVPKVPIPDKFNRARSKLRIFLVQSELYIGFNSQKFSGEDCKVLQITSLLEGVAFNQIKPYLTDYLTNLGDPNKRVAITNTIFRNFTDFKEEITKVFRDVDTERTAERTLQNLKQTRAASRYVVDF